MAEQDIHGAFQEMRRDLDVLITVVDGDPRRDLKGLRVRLNAVETQVDTLLEERQAWTNMIKGARWVLALIGLFTGGTFVTMLAQLFERFQK